MPNRPLLDPSRVHAAIADRWAGWHATTVQQAVAAVAAHPVVVLGMAQNPHVARARRALDRAGVAHHDIDHGSYFGGWRPRSALKMWAGWPTFPMVFVRGTLIGGADETEALLAGGELQRLAA